MTFSSCSVSISISYILSMQVLTFFDCFLSSRLYFTQLVVCVNSKETNYFPTCVLIPGEAKVLSVTLFRLNATKVGSLPPFSISSSCRKFPTMRDVQE